MWSLGCVIAELFLGWPLYPGALEYDQVSIPPSRCLSLSHNHAELVKKKQKTTHTSRQGVANPMEALVGIGSRQRQNKRIAISAGRYF